VLHGLPPPKTQCCIIERIVLESTAYNQCDGSGNRTATGTTVRPGVVAIAPGGRVHLGAFIRVRGEVFHAEDSIGCCSQLDFWVPTCQQAWNWGRRKVEVEVLGPCHKNAGGPVAQERLKGVLQSPSARMVREPAVHPVRHRRAAWFPVEAVVWFVLVIMAIIAGCAIYANLRENFRR